MTGEPAGSIGARKRVELDEKLAGLRAEFASWMDDTEPGKTLRKHQSQIQRLTDQLGGMADGVAELLAAVPTTADGVLKESRIMQLRVLEVHRLWDYFRSKLGLRYVPWFAEYLAAADDLAWECFAPARQAAGPRSAMSRAAPLVFLTDEFSPYTHARDAAYEVEPVPDALPDSEFEAIAATLPVPVIGVPWYQVSHVPDVPLIAHEIGHDLEKELGLTDTMQEHLAPVLADLDFDRAHAWAGWRAELFADLYGVLCLGPAFVASMVDLLATDPEQVADQTTLLQAGQSHPPASLRMRALTEMLSLQGFEVEATTLRESWEETFPPVPADKFLGDVPAVVTALWNGPYSQLKESLQSAIGFSVDQQRLAVAVKELVLEGLPPNVDDIRCLIAGARLAFDADPKGFHRRPKPDKPTAQELILRRMQALRSNAPRKEEVSDSPGRVADHAAGIALFKRLHEATMALTTSSKEGLT